MTLGPRTVDRACLAAALAGPPALAAALVPVRDHTTTTNIALVMVVMVVAVAVPGRRTAAAVAGLGSGIWFDFFAVRPYYSFTISRHDDVETTVLLTIVGVVVGELTARGRRHRDHADAATDDIARIHAVAEMVAAGAKGAEVITAVTNELIDLLGLRDCWFETTFAARPGAVVERQGGVAWGAIAWSPETMGLPSKEVSLVVEGQGRPFGRFVLVPGVGVPVSVDRLTVAVALADQVGAALATGTAPA